MKFGSPSLLEARLQTLTLHETFSDRIISKISQLTFKLFIVPTVHSQGLTRTNLQRTSIHTVNGKEGREEGRRGEREGRERGEGGKERREGNIFQDSHPVLESNPRESKRRVCVCKSYQDAREGNEGGRRRARRVEGGRWEGRGERARKRKCACEPVCTKDGLLPSIKETSTHLDI